MPSELYKSLENRNKRAAELSRQGKEVRRSSIRGQQLHPQYVEDFEGPEKEQTGLGNTVYKTYFPILYEVEWS